MLLLVLTALFLLVPLKPAWAVFDCITDPIDCFTDIVLVVINLVVDFVGLVLIGIAASVVNFVFNFQGFIKVPAVQIGWTMTRDVANMAFILIMLAMAFGTILRYESYGWKKLLPRLVIMALLLNFSLLIAGAVIDVGNSLARFFITGGGDNDVGDLIMTSIRAGSIAQLRNNVSAGSTGTAVGSALNSLIMASVIQLIFYVVIAFLLFALGFMMIYRIVHLWVQIIMAPLAWVGWAIPFASGSAKKWWTSFLQWAFFPAYVGFFIFLGALVGSTLGATDFNLFAKDVGGFWDWLIPTTLFSTIMQFIVVITILFMGLNKANSWGISGAKMMVAAAEKGQKWAKDQAKTYGKRAAGRLAEKALYKKGEGGKRTDLREGLQRLAGTGYGVGRVVGQALRLPTALIEQRQKLVKGAEDKLKGNSTATLKTIFAGLDDMAKAAILRVLADRGDLEFVSEETLIDRKFKKAGSDKKFKDLSDTEKEAERAQLTEEEKREIGKINEDKMGGITQARFEAALKFNGTAGLDKEILNAAPQFAEIVGKKIKDVIEKISPANAAKIQAGSLQLPEVQQAIKEALMNNKWDGSQLSSIGQKNPKALTDLMEFLDKMSDEEKSKMAKRTQNYMKAGGYITFTPTPEPTAEPTPAPTPAPAPARGEI